MSSARGQSIVDLHSCFATALAALEAVRGGYDVKRRGEAYSKAALFAGRVIRAPAASLEEIILKLQAADFLELGTQEVLTFLRNDLQCAASNPQNEARHSAK